MTGPSSTTTDYDVLVAGAGPVGLFAAFLLTRQGISVKIVDKETSPLKVSRAPGIQARSLEIFGMMGLVEEFLEKGRPIGETHVYYGGELTSILPGVSGSKESHYLTGLFLEQYKTEKILYENLEKLGVQVDRGWEVMDTKVVHHHHHHHTKDDKEKDMFVETIIRRAKDGNNTRQGEDKVVGTIEPGQEEEGKEYEYKTIKTLYLIAADGGKSMVRHKLKIPFKGTTRLHNIILWDGDFESEIRPTNMSFINGPTGGLINMFPLSEGNTRFILKHGDIDPENPPNPDELTVEKFEAIVRPMFEPNGFKVTKTNWLTYYRINERHAESYSDPHQRIFLAGDAAHVHSPAGGQGLNLGCADVHNLTWKLALAIQGLSLPSKILSTYGTERIPAAIDVIKLSSTVNEMNLTDTILARNIRRLVLSIAPYIIPYLPTTTTSTVAMLGVKYEPNFLNQVHELQEPPNEIFKIGRRARDATLENVKSMMGTTTGRIEKIRLHQVMVGPGIFHIVIFTSDMLSRENYERIPKDSKIGKVIKGIETTTCSQLVKDIEIHLGEWKSKWFYKDGGQDLFQVHVVTGTNTGSVPEQVVRELSGSIKTNSFLADFKGEGHEKYGLKIKDSTGGIVIVRPDNQVGYRVLGAGPDAWKDVTKYFESILLDKSLES